MDENLSVANRAMAIFLCFLVTVMEGFDLQAIGVAMPMIAPEMGLTKVDIGYALSATMVGLMIGAIFGGWIGDKIGRRLVLCLAVFIFGTATVATIIGHDANSLALIRLFTGIGIGAAMPNIMAINTDISTPANRAFTGMLMFCGFPVGAAVAALIVQVVPDINWQTIFLIGGIPSIILVPLFYFKMPETLPKNIDRQTTVKTSLAHALFGEKRWRVTVCLWFSYALTLVILYLLINWLPTLIVEKGLSRQDGATAALSFNVGSVIGALLLGVAVDKFGLRWPMAIVYTLLLVGFFMLAHADDMTSVIISTALSGACVVGSQFILYGIAPSYYPAHARGIGGGSAVAVGRLGAIIGPMAAGILMQSGMSGDQVVMSLAPVVISGGICVFGLSFFSKHQNS